MRIGLEYVEVDDVAIFIQQPRLDFDIIGALLAGWESLP